MGPVERHHVGGCIASDVLVEHHLEDREAADDLPIVKICSTNLRNANNVLNA